MTSLPKKVDLFIIGAGSGGVRAARIAASYGASVCIAESFRIGGTCVIRGCVPKKLYAYASRFKDSFEDSEGYGWSFSSPPSFEWSRLVAAKEKEITRLSSLYQETLERAGVRIIPQKAFIEAPHLLRLEDGQHIEARIILMATGSQPSLEPACPGLHYTVTSNEIFDLISQPQHLVIIGGGYIAVEFASLFARLGTKVTQIFRAPHLLRGFDQDLRLHLEEALQQEGILLCPEHTPHHIEKKNNRFSLITHQGPIFEADQILLATGRKPCLECLDPKIKNLLILEKSGGIQTDHYGATSIPSLYALGDVTNHFNLTPTAIREGQAFADYIFGKKDSPPLEKNLIPTAVFTTPELATIGWSEDEAAQNFERLAIYTAHFRPLKTALSGRKEKIFIKLIVNEENEQILGLHLFGEEAAEIIQTFAIAFTKGLTKSELNATVALHPTLSEELVTLRTCTRRYDKGKVR